MKGSLRGGRIFSEDHSVRGRKVEKFDKLGKDKDRAYLYHRRDSEDSEALMINPASNHQEDPDDRHHPPFMDRPDQSHSPPHNFSSPFAKSPWSSHMSPRLERSSTQDNPSHKNILIGSLIREEGHIYSLAASGDLLYTGSDSKNIRVWKNQKEFSGFKSNSGLVKAIIIANDKIFTGHQDGKIRVWKISSRDPSMHKRLGTLPSLSDYLKCSLKPSNYVEGRERRNALGIKHYDAISSLSLSEDKYFLYSASWDKTFKVWRVSDSKCLESIKAHDDAVNCLIASLDGLVFTGSADGSVKVWRRELQGKGTKHFFSQTLLKQECAVTALAVNNEGGFIYCGSSDGMINFWEREKSLSHGGVLRGHTLAILCLVTAGSLVISGSAEMGICVWKRIAGEGVQEHVCLSVLTGHTGPVKCLAVEKDGDILGEGGNWILYSGSLDKSVKVWKVSEMAPPMVQTPLQYRSEGRPSGFSKTPSFGSTGRMGSRRS